MMSAFRRPTGSRSSVLASPAVTCLLGLLLASCASTSSNSTAGLQDLGDSLGSSFGKSTDTNGTNRRPDVYGGFTRPSLPTIGSR